MINNKNVHIEIAMTNNCNCNCSYCFESCHSGFKRNIDEEKRQLYLIDDYCKHFNKEKYNNLQFSFWGGEPFLNLDFMCKIIDLTYKYSFVKYHIYTNGTLTNKFEQFLEQKFIDEIKDRINVQLSYDGEPQHSIKRGDNRNLIFNTAHLLMNHNINPSFKATLSFDMIPYLLDIWKSYNELYNEFGNCVEYAPTIDTLSCDKSMLNEWEKQLISITKHEKQFHLQHNRYLMSWFNHPLKCNCQLENNIHIDTDGTIYVCHGCPYAKNKNMFILGYTQQLTSLEQCITCNSNLQVQNENIECLKCEAVHCAKCHIININENDNIIDSWVKNKILDADRCKYYQIFGKIFNAMKFGEI